MGVIDKTPLVYNRPAHRSHSQISAYIKCPEQFRLERLCGAPQYPAAWLHSGSAFHTVAEHYEAGGRSMSEAGARGLFVTEFDTLIAEARNEWPDLTVWGKAGKYSPEDYIASLRLKGPEWCSAYIEFAEASPQEWHIWTLPDGSPAVEIPFWLILGGALVRGYIDQVIEFEDGSLLVRDLKTGTKRPKNDLQLGIYRVALKALFGADVRYGDYYMAKEGKPTKPILLEQYNSQYLELLFEDFDRAVESGAFIPNPTDDNCRPCPVQQFCYAGGGNDPTYMREGLKELFVARN